MRTGLLRLPPANSLVAFEATAGLGAIAACAGELRAPARTEQVSIASSFAFATLWLMPRIGRFILEHPDIELRYVVLETIGDDVAEDVDIRFRYGMGKWPGYTADKLYEDEILAVCSPSYLKRRPTLRTPADLLGERLIQLENVDP